MTVKEELKNGRKIMSTATKKTLSRRAILGGACALGSSYWLGRPNSLPTATAQTDGAPPRRLVIFHSQQGTLRDRWAPTGTETDFQLGELHQASLQRHIPDLLFLKGVAMLSNDVDPIAPASAHVGGSTHSLTGINRASAELAGGPSIDSFIASELSKAGVVTKLPSLELATWGLSGEWNVSYNLDGSPVPFLWSPPEAYARVFGDFVAPDDPTASAKHDQRELLLRWASGEYTEQAQRLSANDRRKLEAHGDLIRDLQRRLSLGVGCAAPEIEPFPPGTGQEENYGLVLESAFRTATAALACDLTRVVTIAATEMSARDIGYQAGLEGTGDVHDLVHKTAENGELRTNPAALAPIIKYHQLHSEQFASFLDMLAATPDSDGTSLLSNTIVLWAGQLGSGSHDLHQLPWILAGQGGGHIRTGRFVDYLAEGKEPAHNDLFVSLARYMGVQIDTFGNPAVCTGELPRLT